ncbi:hypothetical protein Pelo_11627 [Pelomyxa schiedti]|nr:hypothetical protein Pelo_11627 [Pelomyxa schiedti]
MATAPTSPTSSIVAITSSSMTASQQEPDDSVVDSAVSATVETLPPETRLRLASVIDKAVGIRRPVTLIVKNNCPGYEMTVISLILQTGIIYNGPQNPEALPPAAYGDALFWQCRQKFMKGAKGSAFMQLSATETPMKCNFMVCWNHPFGKFPSEYTESHVSPTGFLKLRRLGNERGHSQVILWEVSLSS